MGLENFGILLKEKYEKFNREIFGNILPKEIHINFSDKMTYRAGALYFYKYLNGDIEVLRIVISKKYIEHFPSELDNVLLHEMIHIELKNIEHNKDFQKEMNRINQDFGYDIKVKGYNMKFYYKCKNCGKIFEMNEKLEDLELFCCNSCFENLEYLEVS